MLIRRVPRGHTWPHSREGTVRSSVLSLSRSHAPRSYSHTGTLRGTGVWSVTTVPEHLEPTLGSDVGGEGGNDQGSEHRLPAWSHSQETSQYPPGTVTGAKQRGRQRGEGKGRHACPGPERGPPGARSRAQDDKVAPGNSLLRRYPRRGQTGQAHGQGPQMLREATLVSFLHLPRDLF